MHTDLVAALDIGGTKIAGALVDGHGKILVRAQRPTPSQDDGDTVMRAVEEVLAELTASPSWSRASALGIGSAGPVDASMRHREPGQRARLARLSARRAGARGGR